jgi:hypothetical protein
MRLQEATDLIHLIAEWHKGKTPTLGTLLEEVAELAQSLEEKHPHPPVFELIQIGSIVTHMLTHYSRDDAERAIRERYS